MKKCTTEEPVYASLNYCLLSQKNSLNFIRLTLALMVLFSHSFPLLGVNGNSEEMYGGLAVKLFFVISGYLIFASASRGGNIVGYIWRRFLRIFPGYWFSLLFVAFIAYPLANLLRHSSGFNFSSAFRYIISNYDLMSLRWDIDNSPFGVPYEGVWNGSSWTLGYEFLCYLMVIPLAFLPIVRKYKKFFTTSAYLLSLLMFPILEHVDASTNRYYLYARLIPFFLSGSLLFVWGDKIKVNRILVLLFIFLMIFIHVLDNEIVNNFSHLIFSYGILGLGVVLPMYFGYKNDVSYGVYIYAFPIQQILVMLGSANLGPYINTILVAVLSMFFGYISWVFIEKPSMKLKRIIK